MTCANGNMCHALGQAQHFSGAKLSMQPLGGKTKD